MYTGYKLECQPRVSLQRLLAPVPVVVEDLLTSFYVLLGYQHEPGHLLDHDNLGDAVGRHSGVVDKSSVATRLGRGVNAENILLNKALSVVR